MNYNITNTRIYTIAFLFFSPVLQSMHFQPLRLCLRQKDRLK